MRTIHHIIQMYLTYAWFLHWSHSSPPTARLSQVDWNSYHETEPQGPGTYAFGYDVDDALTGNTQFRQEERHPNGTVTGLYGVVHPDGTVRIIHYIADQYGYRIKYENVVTTEPPYYISSHARQLKNYSG